MKHISLFISFILTFLLTNVSFSQTVQEESDQILLDACLENNFSKVFKMLGEGYNLKKSKEASYELYKLLQNQTKVESSITMVNFEVVKTKDYYLRKPEDNEIFTLLLRAGTDTSLYHIVGLDVAGTQTTQISSDVNLISGGEDSNNSEIVFQTDDGFSAYEYALVNGLSTFIEAFDIISFPLIRNVTDPDAVEQLLTEGCDVNQVSEVKGYTALNLASQHGNREIIEILLKQGANPDLAQKNGLSPISIAAFRGDVWLGKKLIEAGATIFSYIDGEILPFKYAVLNNHVDFVALLLENGMDVNYQFEESSYAAYYAAQEGHLDMLKMLIEHGADFEQKVNGGQTPLCIACFFGHLDVAKYLVERGAKLDDPEFGFNTPLMHAYTHGFDDLVLYLLNAGADPSVKDHQGKSLIHFSAYHNNEVILDFLLSKGADPDIKMDHDATPIFIATQQGHLNIVSLLLDYKADPDIPDDENTTPLLLAVKAHNYDMVKLLLNGNADPNYPLKNNETAIFAALGENDLDMLDILLDGGADINARNKHGENLLFMTADDVQIRYLYKNGIEHDEVNQSGETALTDALLSKNIPKARLLIELGSSLDNTNSKITVFNTNKAFKTYLKEHGATFRILDERYEYEDAFYTNFNLVFGMGVYAPKSIEQKSWPFSMGLAVGITPINRLKVNTNILLNFMGVSDIYFSNLHLQPTLRFTASPKGYFVGGGFTWNYLLGVSSSKYPEVSISDGFKRTGIAPYFTVGYEDNETSFEVGYRMRTATQPGIFCINLGYEISALFY